jgi:dihydroorotate dehydrogenase (fumarate)
LTKVGREDWCFLSQFFAYKEIIMVDLNTNYLGLTLKNPIVAASSPLSQKVKTVKKLEKAGVSAVVMHSLFEEQIIREGHKLHEDIESTLFVHPESLDFFPDYGQYSIGPEKYLEHLKKVKEAVDIPVIGSLNGISTGGWIEYAQKIEEAGADALELNIYYLPTDVEISSAELETAYTILVKDICTNINIPVAVKLSPSFTALPNFSRGLVDAGAKGLVFFNRFYQPDFDLDALEVTPNLQLSSSDELRLPLRWIAILYGRVEADFALTSGVHKHTDVLKAMMAGAKVCMITSAFLKKGPEKATKILAKLTEWMEENEYESIQQMQGSMSQQAVADPSSFERVNYMKVLSSYR